MYKRKTIQVLNLLQGSSFLVTQTSQLDEVIIFTWFIDKTTK